MRAGLKHNLPWQSVYLKGRRWQQTGGESGWEFKRQEIGGRGKEAGGRGKEEGSRRLR